MVGGGCANKWLEMLISVNTGGRAEVILTQTLETGGGGGGCGADWGCACLRRVELCGRDREFRLD